MDIVMTSTDYTYDMLERDIKLLKIRYPFLEVGIGGISIMGKNLYYIRMGNGPREVFYNAAHHATEWVTAPLLMKFIENFSNAYSKDGNIRGYDIRKLYKEISIYIMPMVNPDGVDLVLGNINLDNPCYKYAVSLNVSREPLRLVWKANIRGVDLNSNYPALWDREKQYELMQGITGPAPKDYGGPYPLSEPETRAVVEFTRSHNFSLVMAFHTQGREIYWQFQNLAPPDSLTIARQFASISGYSVELNPPEASYAGYKDWFIQEYRRPGFTIESGTGINAVHISQFDTMYNETEGIMLYAAAVGHLMK